MGSQFTAFGLAPGAGYVETPLAWSLNPIRQSGFGPGKVLKQNLNTPIRQASTIATVLAQFIANNQPADVNDDGDLVTLLAQLQLALSNFTSGSGLGLIVSMTGASGQLKFPASLGGLIIKWGTTPTYAGDSSNVFSFPATGAGPTALPGAFPVACFGAVISAVTNNGISPSSTNYAPACNSFTPSQMTVMNDTAAASAMFYVAIGR